MPVGQNAFKVIALSLASALPLMTRVAVAEVTYVAVIGVTPPDGGNEIGLECNPNSTCSGQLQVAIDGKREAMRISLSFSGRQSSQVTVAIERPGRAIGVSQSDRVIIPISRAGTGDKTLPIEEYESPASLTHANGVAPPVVSRPL